jgi:DNA-binding CsgD family transcriptional regulator/PAS domain-containing protein
MTSDEIAISQLIGDIYDAALDPTLWPRALEGTCRFVRGCGSRIMWQDAANNAGGIFHTFGDDPHYARLYFERYADLNPLFPASAFVEPGEVMSTGDLMPMAEFVNTRFYKEWVQPQGFVDVVVANLEKSTTSAASFSVTRGERDGLVDDEARRRMKLLVPHVQRAVVISHLVERNATEAAALADTLGRIATAVFLVDAAGRIVFANAAAESVLASKNLFRSFADGLVALEPEADRALHDVFAAAGRGDVAVGIRGVAVPLRITHAERWFAHILPLGSGARQHVGAPHGAVAALFVRQAGLDTPSALETLAKLYQLTASEVRVLQAVVDIGGVQAIAQALGISQPTVKTHLHNIFQKTATKRQSELVKLVAGSASPFVE